MTGSNTSSPIQTLRQGPFDEATTLRLRTVSRVAAIAALALGLLGICGWGLGWRSLVSFGDGLATMKPMTSLSMLCLSIALLLSEAQRAFASMLAALAALTAVASLALEVQGEAWALTYSTVHLPQTMSTATAIGTAFLALGVLTRGRKLARLPNHFWSDWFAGAGALIGLIALLGYLYDVEDLYGVGPFASVSLPTALGLSLLSLALTLSEPRTGVAALVSSETSGGMLARRLAIPIMIIPVAFGSLVTMGVHRGSVPLTFAVVLSTTLSIALLGRLIWSAGLRLRRMDLDHRASELQRQLLSERLRHADKMESLGRVSGGIAHDFNNLLTIVSTYAEAIREEASDHPQITRDVEQIEEASKSGQALTAQLLSFGGPQGTEIQDLDLNAVVEKMTAMLSRTLRSNVELVLELDGHLPLTRAEPAALEQILLNLLVNAHDAMPHGGKIVITTGHPQPGKQDLTDQPKDAHVHLSVKDNGCGMDARTRERIFDPFFTTKGEKGTGLGLATVYSLVEQNHGGLDVSSEEGLGTTFDLYFPAIERASSGTHTIGGARPSAPPSDRVRRSIGTDQLN